jgi:hypothetical protein
MIKKRKKLTHEEKKLASRYISEEIKTKKYPPKQAIAIGISRARAKRRKNRRRKMIERIMSIYR